MRCTAMPFEFRALPCLQCNTSVLRCSRDDSGGDGWHGRCSDVSTRHAPVSRASFRSFLPLSSGARCRNVAFQRVFEPRTGPPRLGNFDERDGALIVDAGAVPLSL